MFKTFSKDSDEQQLMPLWMVKDLQVLPVSHAGVVALYLATTPNEETGKKTETQWALTLDQAQWLSNMLLAAISTLQIVDTSPDSDGNDDMRQEGSAEQTKATT